MSFKTHIAKEAAKNPDGKAPRVLRAMRIPVLQFFLFWFVATPSLDGLEKIMNVLGIMDALMLTLVVGMVGTVDYEEMRAADERFIAGADTTGINDTEPYRKIWYKSKNWVVGLADKDYPTPPRMYQDYLISGILSPSEKLMENVIISTFLFTTSLLMIVFLYVYLSLAEIDKEPEEEDSQDSAVIRARHKAKTELSLWYSYCTLPLTCSILMFQVGVIIFFRSLWYLVMIKSPDYRVLTENDWVSSGVYVLPALLGVLIAVLIIITVFMAGWGLYSVMAYNHYGVPQSWAHVIFFMKPKTKADVGDGSMKLAHGGGGSGKVVPVVHPEPPADSAEDRAALEARITAAVMAKVAEMLAAEAKRVAGSNKAD